MLLIVHTSQWLDVWLKALAGGQKGEKLSHIIVEKHISKYCFYWRPVLKTKLSVVDIIVINFSYTALSCHWLNFPSTNQTLRASGALMRVCETYRLFSPRVWCGISVWTCLSESVNDKLRSLMNQKRFHVFVVLSSYFKVRQAE